MRNALFASAFVAVIGMASALFAPAQAAPTSGLAGTKADTGVANVNYRPYRHCHWRHGRRWCHGPHYGYGYDYYGYGYSPGIYLRFGHGHRHGHRHRFHGHRGIHRGGRGVHRGFHGGGRGHRGGGRGRH